MRSIGRCGGPEGSDSGLGTLAVQSAAVIARIQDYESATLNSNHEMPYFLAS
jgi:hypothetical protein